MGDEHRAVTRGAYGERAIDPSELGDSYEPLDEEENIKAKVWEPDHRDERCLYIRVRSHEDGRRYDEWSIPLGGD